MPSNSALYPGNDRLSTRLRMLVDLEHQARHAKMGREVSVLESHSIVLNTGGKRRDHIRVKWFLNGVQECRALGPIVQDHALLGLKAVIEMKGVCKFEDIPVKPSRHVDLNSGIKSGDQEG